MGVLGLSIVISCVKIDTIYFVTWFSALRCKKRTVCSSLPLLTSASPLIKHKHTHGTGTVRTKCQILLFCSINLLRRVSVMTQQRWERAMAKEQRWERAMAKEQRWERAMAKEQRTIIHCSKVIVFSFLCHRTFPLSRYGR